MATTRTLRTEKLNPTIPLEKVSVAGFLEARPYMTERAAKAAESPPVCRTPASTRRLPSRGPRANGSNSTDPSEPREDGRATPARLGRWMARAGCQLQRFAG